jgi:hypothetical protein
MADRSFAATGMLPGQFLVGDVFSKSFSILSRNLVPFLGLSALANLLPFLALLMPLGISAVISQGQTPHAGWIIATAVVAGLLSIVMYALSQAFLLHGAFQDMLDRPVRAGESLRVALARFFPLIGLSICMGIAIAFPVIVAVGLGALSGVFFFFVLLIPAGIVSLIWLTMWFIAVPGCVVERLGPIASLSRSAELTKGHRWKVFAIILVIFVVQVIVQLILGQIAVAMGGELAGGLLVWAWGVIYTAFQAVITVVIYHDLRVAKEGVDTGQIASVFA